jgi:putative endonuclease
MNVEKSERGKKAQARGVEAETRVCAWLLAHHFQVLHRRYKTKAGEIDIIAGKQEMLVFIEVKARKTLDEAAFSLSQRQISRLTATAEIFLGENPQFTQCRFDVFLIAEKGAMRHIENAIEG